MKILIDNGHGLMTAGKRSPDGLFREAFYNRETARKVVADLLDRNLDAELLVPEDDDISLSERVRRINAACFLLGKRNIILVSIHVNAAGNGSKWLNATGGASIPARGRPSQTNSQNASARQQSRTSLDAASEPTSQTEIWTRRKVSIFFVSPGVQLC